MLSYSPELYCAWLAIHAAGIMIACIARVTAGSRQESAARMALISALIVIGAMAIIQQCRDCGGWHVTGATLVAMVIAAVSDFSRTCEPSPGWSHN